MRDLRSCAVGLLPSAMALAVAFFTILMGAGAQEVGQAFQAKKDTVDAKAIQALIGRLGDDDYAAREGAQMRLAEIGEPTLELLQKALKGSTDAEVRERATTLVRRIENQLFPEILSFRAHPSKVTRVAVTPDGKHLVTTGVGGMRLWDAKTGKELLTYHKGSEFWALAISPDGKQVIGGSNDKIARVFELTSGKLISELKGHQQKIWAAALYDGNKRAVTGGMDKSLLVWDVNTGAQVATFPGVVEMVRCLAVSPDGKSVAVGHFGEGNAPPGTLRLWNLATLQEIKEFKGHKREVTSVSFSADGNLLLTSSFDQTVRIWEVHTGKELKCFQGTSRIECAAFVNDGRRVIFAGNEVDPCLQMWDVADARRIFRSQNVPGGYLGVAPLPADNVVVAAGRDGNVRLLSWKK